MKIQFATKQMTIPERVYSHAEHRINELDPFFRGTPEAAVVFGAEDGKAVVELTIFARVYHLPGGGEDLGHDGFYRRRCFLCPPSAAGELRPPA